jgi:hypothetical protein
MKLTAQIAIVEESLLASANARSTATAQASASFQTLVLIGVVVSQITHSPPARLT